MRRIVSKNRVVAGIIYKYKMRTKHSSGAGDKFVTKN